MLIGNEGFALHENLLRGTIRILFLIDVLSCQKPPYGGTHLDKKNITFRQEEYSTTA